jgi:hypothetical protein
LGGKSESNRAIIFSCYDYTVGRKESLNPQIEENLLFKIGLPLPNSFSETNNQKWGGAVAGLAGAANNLITGLTRKFASSALGGPALNSLKAANGLTQNPAEELVYQGPEFRTFTFSFDFIPTNKEEMNTAKAILYLFKKYSLPTLVKAEMMVSFPAIWQIKIVGVNAGDMMMEFGFREKLFAVTGITTNYTPDQAFFSFTNGFPVHSNLSINISETTPLYRNDAGGDEAGEAQILSALGDSNL